MGYVIKKLPQKKSDPKWKVQYSSRKKSLAKNKEAKYPSRAWDIPKERWSGIGIHKNMSLEEVRERVKQLNAQLAVKRNEELKLRHEERLRRFDQEVCAFLPKDYKEEFEARFFHHYRDQKRLRQNKKMSHWRAAQRLIIHLKVGPTMWRDSLIQIYDWIAEQEYSPNYYKQVLRIFNEWGFFISRRTDRPFIPISYPKGLERARLLDIYYSKEERSKASDPTHPEQLEKARFFLKEEHYNWLFISVCFGLRPKEIDNLKTNSRISRDEDGTLVLWVYQTKITSVHPMNRWKPIPAILPEQEKALEFIRKGKYKRPRTKLVRKYIGEGNTLYGGRKGFTDLMLRHNQHFANISQWLGHSSLDRTWKHYKDKRQYHYKKTA